MYSDNSDIKMPRFKRFLQTLIWISLVVYAALLVYQKNVSAESDTSSKQEVVWQERAPRSLMGDYESNAAAEVGPRPTQPPPAPPAPADVFISVKTTVHYHQARLPVILKTWFQLAKHQTWFFTDSDDEEFQQKTNGHMINTNCSSSHNRKALCCKMSVEFDTFLESDKKWFCHFDDDNYVNVPRLIRLLAEYNPQEDWYLGKPSIRTPLEILNREPKPKDHGKTSSSYKKNISFWFATGGAGFCLSRALALKMIPLASGGKFMGIGEKIRLPDDVTMGYIIEHMLKKPLTVIDQFHSHLEPMKFLRPDSFQDQITFSYSKYSKDEMNVVRIDGFDTRIDPTRFLSLHCYLFPHFKFCPR